MNNPPNQSPNNARPGNYLIPVIKREIAAQKFLTSIQLESFSRKTKRKAIRQYVHLNNTAGNSIIRNRHLILSRA